MKSRENRVSSLLYNNKAKKSIPKYKDIGVFFILSIFYKNPTINKVSKKVGR